MERIWKEAVVACLDPASPEYEAGVLAFQYQITVGNDVTK
jgi:hypothetical protein